MKEFRVNDNFSVVKTHKIEITDLISWILLGILIIIMFYLLSHEVCHLDCSMCLDTTNKLVERGTLKW